MTDTTTGGATATAGRESPGLLIDIGQLVVLLRRSAASLERDQAAGRLPAPVYVGGSRRWRRQEIEDWVRAGCPNRERWEAIRDASRSGRSAGGRGE